MEDFDNDGLLDIAVTSFDCHAAHVVLPQQGRWDLRGPLRGGRSHRATGRAWSAIRPTTTTTVAWTSSFRAGRGSQFADPADALAERRRGRLHRRHQEAGLLDPVNSNAAAWADYDNDGWVDLFVGCERQTNRLYHNKGDGTFEEVAAQGGRAGRRRATFARDAPGSTTTTTVIPTCSSTIWPGPAGCITTIATAPSPTSRRPWASMGP